MAAIPHSTIDTPRRPAIVIALHWMTLAVLLLGVALVLVRDEFDGRALRNLLLEGHRHFGLLVLGLLIARLAVRFARRRLPAIDSASPLARAAAGTTHALLYLLLAGVPLLGWIASNAHGHDIHFFGLPLPALTEADDDFADTLQQWHTIAAWTMLVLGLLHALAALWHHFIRRDPVLTAMLPQWRKKRSPDNHISP